MKIAWQTRSKLLFDSITCNELLPGSNGGNIYDFEVVQTLRDKYDLSAYDKAVWRNDNPVSYWFKLKSQPKVQLSILEPSPVVFGTFSKNQKYIAIVHHIDLDRMNNSYKHKWFFNRLLTQLKKMDRIVTVSTFWKEFLEKKGCKNVQVIYNSFELKNYSFNTKELDAFKSKLGFNVSKPLVHIGNASAEKGVHEVYEALKDMDVQLVMTGGANRVKELPVRFYSLPSKEYRMLLASCDAVIAFSSMMEGWNRIAHEAMLCRVPVIGSGVGGMQELLDGGKQLATSSKVELKDALIKALEQKKEFGENGYAYASQFNMDYFRKTWFDLICELK